MEYEEFLRNLKKARRQQGFSMRELGEKIGVTAQQIANIESGYSQLTMKNFLRICEGLSISPRSLIEEKSKDNEYLSLEQRIRNLEERDFQIISQLINFIEEKK